MNINELVIECMVYNIAVLGAGVIHAIVKQIQANRD
ncbi:hypothetical protein IGI95_002669 [Enterococcus sp. DIV0784]